MFLCMNSIGSSMVRMCRRSVWLMWLIIAASVELLPEPVAPVTSTSPRSLPAIVFSTCGSPSSSSVGILAGMMRRMHASEPRCR